MLLHLFIYNYRFLLIKLLLSYYFDKVELFFLNILLLMIFSGIFCTFTYKKTDENSTY